MPIKYMDGYKYQLVEDYFHIFPKDSLYFPEPFTDNFIEGNGNKLRIYKGYAWDGPSGPSIDTKNFMRGSLVHDALYQCMREGYIDRKYKDLADRELQRICKEDGMSSIRAWYVYQGVRMFGYDSTIKQRKIQVAP